MGFYKVSVYTEVVTEFVIEADDEHDAWHKTDELLERDGFGDVIPWDKEDLRISSYMWDNAEMASQEDIEHMRVVTSKEIEHYMKADGSLT